MKKTFTLLLSVFVSLFVSIPASALVKNADGVYELGTASELMDFAALVNSAKANRTLSAVLTNDIDMSQVANFTPIGTYSDTNGTTISYRGTFDGQGHIISNLTIDCNDTWETGLFSRLVDANIKNLGIVNAHVKSEAGIRAGVLAGLVYRSKVSDCFVVGDISVETTNAGIGQFAGELDSDSGTSKITNCYTLGDSFGLQGKVTFTNCYCGDEARALAPTGELCWRLNEGDFQMPSWFQTLGEDAYPTQDSDRGTVAEINGVYYDLMVEESLHTFAGYYTASVMEEYGHMVCQQELLDDLSFMSELFAEPEDIYGFLYYYTYKEYLIVEMQISAKAYADYAQKVEEAKALLEQNPQYQGAPVEELKKYIEETYPANWAARTMSNDQVEKEIADIQSMIDRVLFHNMEEGTDITSILKNADMSKEGFEGWTFSQNAKYGDSARGDGNPFVGEVDSKPFTLSQIRTDLPDGLYMLRLQGFFAWGENSGTEVPVLVGLNGSEQRLLSVSADEAGEEPTTAEEASAAFAAGRYEQAVYGLVENGALTILLSDNRSSSTDWSVFTNFRLTYYGQNTEALDNALMSLLTRVDEFNLSPYPFYDQLLFDLCYTILEGAEDYLSGAEKMEHFKKALQYIQDVQASMQQYALLQETLDAVQNAYWSSANDGLIGQDLAQEFEQKYNDLTDRMAEYDLSDEEVAAQIRELENDIVFRNYNGEECELVDGFYQIGNPQQLIWFGRLVNSAKANRTLSAVLTNDIDMSQVANFTPIGTYSDTNGTTISYRGTFDGQGHIISNLTIDCNDTWETGLFSRLIDANIKNLGIVNAHVRNNCGVRCGILVGLHYRANITNCFVAGDLSVETTNEGIGFFAGEIDGEAKATNCYTLGASMGKTGSCTLTNCYCGEEALQKAPTGELCWLLNESSAENPVWRQTLGEDSYPLFGESHLVVCQEDGTFLNIGGNNISRTEIRQSGSWYDLSGRRVASPSAGVYIHEGKVVIVR